uniref:Uncharacterized protein n=1 Tax=Anguilla anguilla TaxID=7936 RepID=A0A0E9RK78_ANGAN
MYLTKLLSGKFSSYSARSQECITLDIPRFRTELGKTTISVAAPYMWNEFQESLKLTSMVSFELFKDLVAELLELENVCNC